MSQSTETFSVILSIHAFLKDILDRDYSGLNVFTNHLLTLAERERIASLTRYLRIETTPGEIHYDQPFDISFRLWATPDADPTTFWLEKAPYQIMQSCLNEKTNVGLNMVALYDYDALVGQAAIDTFYQNGTIPTILNTIAQKRFPDVLMYVRNGRQIGLKPLPTAFAPEFDFQSYPMYASWNMEFRYFEPRHQKAVRPIT